MKRALAISVLLNIALLLSAARQDAHDRIPSRIPRLEIRASIPHSDRGAFGLSTRTASDPSTPWSGIESADPASLIANLRRLGCPEQTIRDIVVLRLGRTYRNELLRTEAEAARSWDYTRARKDWPERLRCQSELRDEMQTKLERLFGQSWASITMPIMGWPSPPADIYAFVAEEKRQQIRKLERQHVELKAQLERQQSQSAWVAPDNTPLMELERQHQADLASMLSPQEMMEYLYRVSPAAKYVLENLPAAQNEGEFRTMVSVAQQFELWNQPATSISQRYGSPAEPGGEGDASADAASADYAARKAAFDQRLKEVLGEDRVAQQRTDEQTRAEERRNQDEARAQERAREQIATAAAAVGVEVEAANRFFSRMKQLEPELGPKFEQLEQDFTGTEEEKAKAMKAAVRAEIGRIATEFMGAKAHAFVEKMDK